MIIDSVSVRLKNARLNRLNAYKLSHASVPVGTAIACQSACDRDASDVGVCPYLALSTHPRTGGT